MTNTDNKCNICGSNELSIVESFPQYPRNYTYTTNKSDDYQKDFTLFHCCKCSHVQGVSDYALDDLYCDGYSTVRDNLNFKNRRNFFVQKTLAHCYGKKYNRVIDVGCSNLSLLKELKKQGITANHWIGIDPIACPKEHLSDEISFIQGYIPDIDLPYFDKNLPDLVVSDQVFEHIPNVTEILVEFSNRLSPDSHFIVCYPSLELLIKDYNFPSIFHEHLNYYSEHSLSQLFKKAEFTTEFSELFKENWGLLFQVHVKNNSGKCTFKNRDFVSEFKRNFDLYKSALIVTKEILATQSGKIYGFGASDITASFAYFLKSDLSMLDCIIDDTPYKENMYIPGLKPKIVKSADIDDWSDVTVLITAPQASRAILKRLIELNPKKIISPLNVF